MGLHRKGTGRTSVTYAEALDEALCFGWIDGVRKRVDAVSYTIRFTPRKARSTWSSVNIARANELISLGRMAPAGLAAFGRRTPERSGRYSYEARKDVALAPADRRRLRANVSAWSFFSSRPPSYQRTATWWVTSAKKEETRRHRLEALIECSARGLPAPPFIRPRQAGFRARCDSL